MYKYTTDNKLFAEIDENNIVIRVIVVDSADLANSLFGGTWVETTIHKNKNYARIGSTYIPTTNNFINPQPGPDYILRAEDLRWIRQPEPIYSQLFYGAVPKILITEDNVIHTWNKTKQDWDEL
jgi:hypothetical protein